MAENKEIRKFDPFLMNRSEAARFLGIGINTLYRLNIPKTKIRKRILYRRDILEQWAKDNTEQKVAEA